jgi:hypothetical protein
LSGVSKQHIKVQWYTSPVEFGSYEAGMVDPPTAGKRKTKPAKVPWTAEVPLGACMMTFDRLEDDGSIPADVRKRFEKDL